MTFFYFLFGQIKVSDNLSDKLANKKYEKNLDSSNSNNSKDDN